MSQQEKDETGGLSITKSYLFYCMKGDDAENKPPPTTPKQVMEDEEFKQSDGCGNKFLKLMIVDLSQEESEDFSRFKV